MAITNLGKYLNLQITKAREFACDFQIHNALLSAGIILQVEHSTKQAGVGLIVIWLSINFIAHIIGSKNKPNKGEETLYAALLGLLLIQARSIINIEDEFGLTQYFLIAIGMATAACLTIQRWKRLLQWLGITSIPLLILYMMPQANTLLPATRALGTEITSISNALTNTLELRSYFQETVFSFLTTFGILSGRISKSLTGKIIGYSSGLSGLALCLLIDSRMAVIAPVISILIGIITCHLGALRRFSLKAKFAIISTFTALILSIIFAVVINPDMGSTSGVRFASDRGRINVAWCWANSMLAGDNRFLYGTGHNKEFIMKRCTDAKVGNFWVLEPESKAGHAHNVLAHMMGLHGLFGIISLVILACIYLKGLIYFAKAEKIFTHLPLNTAPWFEAITSTGIFMIICSTSTTFFIYNHTLQVIIGLALGMPLAKHEQIDNKKF